eukprot:3844392-Amphidinium_carterae.1
MNQWKQISKAQLCDEILVEESLYEGLASLRMACCSARLNNPVVSFMSAWARKPPVPVEDGSC